MQRKKERLTASWHGVHRIIAIAKRIDRLGRTWKMECAEGSDVSRQVASKLLRCSEMTVLNMVKRRELSRGTHGGTSVRFSSVKSVAFRKGIITKIRRPSYLDRYEGD